MRVARCSQRSSPVASAAREERLDPVHVGVGPAVGLARLPCAVPRLDERARVVVPEVAYDDVGRPGEQVLRARDARRSWRSMPPAARRRARTPSWSRTGRPSVSRRGNHPPCSVSPKSRSRRGEPEVDELGVAGPAEQVAEAEHVGHPCGDPQLLAVAAVHAAVVVEPPELAVLRGRPGAVEQPVDLRA